VGDRAAVSLFLARPLPDPSAGSTLLRFGLPAAGRARLEILDVAGRLVWHDEEELPAGEHAWRWSGEADQGGRAGTGLYFVRLVTPSGMRTERLVRLR
jgi:flagellar hook assembly protein FlgD